MQVLIVYDSQTESLRILAQYVAEGAQSVDGAEVLLQLVKETRLEQLLEADAIILGSPNWHGMTAELKELIDETGLYWEEGRLAGKVGAAFTTGWSHSGGTEFTLLSILHTLLAHGMIIVGLPWSRRMASSSSYYGASSLGLPKPNDQEQARALGRRVAEVATAMVRGTGRKLGGVRLQTSRGYRHKGIERLDREGSS